MNYAKVGLASCDEVRTDGSDLTYIDPNKFRLMCIENETMYMVHADARFPSRYGIYKMTLSGTSMDQPVKIFNYRVDWLYVRDGWLFFNYEHNLCKMRIDGTGLQIVHAVVPASTVYDITMVGEWLYFTDALEFGKSKFDGSEYTEIYDWGSVIGNGRFHQVLGAWFYYRREPEDQIYKMRLDGSASPIKVAEHTMLNFNLQEDGSIYMLTGPITIWGTNINGTEERFISDDFRDCIILNGWIYGMDDTASLYRVRTDGTGQEKFVNVLDLEDK